MSVFYAKGDCPYRSLDFSRKSFLKMIESQALHAKQLPFPPDRKRGAAKTDPIHTLQAQIIGRTPKGDPSTWRFARVSRCAATPSERRAIYRDIQAGKRAALIIPIGRGRSVVRIEENTAAER